MQDAIASRGSLFAVIISLNQGDGKPALGCIPGRGNTIDSSPYNQQIKCFACKSVQIAFHELYILLDCGLKATESIHRVSKKCHAREGFCIRGVTVYVRHKQAKKPQGRDDLAAC